MWARISWTCWSASTQRMRVCGLGGDVEPCRMASSVLAPKPFKLADPVRLGRPRGARRAWRCSVPGAGPPPASAPGRARAAMASTLSGTSASSSSSIGSEPPATSVAIFSARSLPMPSMSVSLPLGIGHDLGHRLGQVVDRAGGVAIGPHAERVRALELQQVGDLLENGGDFGVGHGWCILRGLGSWEWSGQSSDQSQVRLLTCATPPRPCRAARNRP